MSNEESFASVLESLALHLGDERVRLSVARDVIAEATLALTDVSGMVHMRVATITFHLIEQLNLSRMLNDPAFWVENIRDWELLGLYYEPLNYSVATVQQLVTYAHVRQSLLPTYLSEWMKALQSDHPERKF